MRAVHRGFAGLVALFLWMAAPAHLPAQQPQPERPKFKGGEKISIDGEFDIKDFAKMISNLAGKNFVLDERVRGKITIISPDPVTVDEAFRVFETVLQVRQFALVPAGPVMKIIPSSEAKQEPIPTSGAGDELEPVDRMITRLVPLKFVPAEEVEALLRDLVSRNGVVKSYAPTNILIFIDTSANIRRMMQIIETLDIPGFEDVVEIIPVRFADVTVLAQQVSQIFVEQTGRQRRPRPGTTPQQGAGTGITKIIPDDRLNFLIVVGPRLEIEKLRQLVAELDRPLEAGGGRIHVRGLSFADAEELAQVLANLVAGLPTRQQPGAKPPGGTAGPAAGAITPSVTLEGNIKITADKATNSLIIIASQKDYDTIEDVIEMLDVRRRQVFVEGAILEISFDRRKDFGIVAHVGKANADGTITFGGTNLGGASTLVPLGAAGGAAGGGLATFAKPGMFVGILGEGFELDVGGSKVKFPTFGAFLNALAADEDVNILSTPQILTVDNEDAEIVVGSNIPFITQTQQSTLAGAPIIQNIERRDVGINLKVTPQISEGGSVRLTIAQEISAVSEQVPTGFQVGQQGLITRKRSVKNTVVVENGQTVVIGGLIEDTTSVSESKVPILGDIPIIGWLFRSSKKRLLKTNLLIFLTPYIVTTPEELQDIAIRKSQEIQRTLERATKEHRKAAEKIQEKIRTQEVPPERRGRYPRETPPPPEAAPPGPQAPPPAPPAPPEPPPAEPGPAEPPPPDIEPPAPEKGP
ncbi:MAG: type II secretion system secretin GspD [Nitrospirae bacterium]|nr:type II secretion system secretin GspD [Nitrospirota bacterium]